jgi:hypothetical protein
MDQSSAALAFPDNPSAPRLMASTNPRPINRIAERTKILSVRNVILDRYFPNYQLKL